MRILFLPQLSMPPVGGGPRFVYETARALQARGDECVFPASPLQSRSDYLNPFKTSAEPCRSEEGFRFEPTQVTRLAPLFGRLFGRFVGQNLGMCRGLELQSAPPSYSDLEGLIASVRPDVIHAVSFPQAYNYDALLAARASGVPLMLTPFYHYNMIGQGDSYHQLNANPLLLETLRGADRVMVCTTSEREHLETLGVDRARVPVIPMGIHPDTYTQVSGSLFRETHGLGDRPLLMDMSTQKCSGKGSLHVLKAIEQLQRERPELGFASIGASSDEWERALRASSAEVIDLGYIEGDQKLSAFAAADLFVHPSHNDAFGIVYLEAWASTCPVVGADTRPMREVIVDGRDGILVPFGDAGALASRIGDLLDDRPRLDEMGRAGLVKAQGYSWSRVADMVRSSYAELCA